MKRSVYWFGLPVALLLGSGFAFAQHGHGAGGGMSGMHGASSTHASANESTGAGHTTSSMMASKNPGDVLDHNSHLSSKLEGLLHLSGPDALTTLKTDASGFKNFGQFVAAVHVSHNLGISFSDLQAKMTGPPALSLNKVIQALRPDADAANESKRATSEAKEDLNDSSS
jgi:hypothetical protein